MSTQQTLLGDPLPRALADYYSALDDSRFDDAIDTFTDDASYVVQSAAEEASQSRTEHSGKAALRDHFALRGPQPWRHETVLCVADADRCLLEGVVRATSNGSVMASFAASAQLSPDGRCRRYLAYATSWVRPSPAEAAAMLTGRPGDGVERMHEYFRALDEGTFEQAAECFSEDTLYSHPPYRNTGLETSERVAFRGRAQLQEKFRARGKQSFTHRLLVCLQRGPHCLVEGVVENLPAGGSGSFVSSLTLDGAGLIRRYVAFYCAPAVA